MVQNASIITNFEAFLFFKFADMKRSTLNESCYSDKRAYRYDTEYGTNWGTSGKPILIIFDTQVHLSVLYIL